MPRYQVRLLEVWMVFKLTRRETDVGGLNHRLNQVLCKLGDAPMVFVRLIWTSCSLVKRGVEDGGALI